MNITVDHQEDCNIALRAELTADEVSSERKKVISSFASQAKVPGFRPGKVPSSVIEKRYGTALRSR